MAKLERNLTGDFDALLEHLHRGLLRENASISCEDGSDYCSADGLRCAVRVYERYSMIGGNRVSLNLTLVGEGRDIFLSAITSGGSRAVVFKINTLGEGAFLDCVEKLLDDWRPAPDPQRAAGTEGEKRPCPCCGNYTLYEPSGSYEFCPVCGWTDDPWAEEHPEETGDHNGVSLETARCNYRMFGVCTEGLHSQVRPPEPEELPEVYLCIHRTDS